MWVELSCTAGRVVRATPEERAWIREYLSFPDATAHFRGGERGATRSMYNVLDDTFPVGFLELARKAAEKEGFKLEVFDKRPAAPALEPDPDLEWLRDYQREAVAKVLARERGICWLSTGAGKTEIMVGLARAVAAPWLFLAHRTGLAVQAAERFALRSREHGVDLGEPGVIGEGRWSEGERLTCATFQTLHAALLAGDARARALLGRSRGLVVDECHVLPAESFWRVAMAASAAHYRVGLSGTPLARGDQRSVLAIAALGPVIYRVRADRLIEAGVLAKPRVRLVPVMQPTSSASTWAEVYRDRVVNSARRNAAVVEAVKRAEKPCFVFVQSVAHGKRLAKLIAQAGIPSDFAWGKLSTEARRTKVDWLMREGYAALVCSVVFQEGIDVPGLRSVIVATGGKSVIATIQRAGRGMRVERDAEGNVIKGEFEVWDFLDKAPREVGETPSWLERHAAARKHSYVAEGYETIVEPFAPGELAAAGTR